MAVVGKHWVWLGGCCSCAPVQFRRELSTEHMVVVGKLFDILLIEGFSG